MVVDWEKSGPGALASTEKFALVSKRKSTDWPLMGSSSVINMGTCVRTPGTFSPDCLESPTPGAYALEGVSSAVQFLQT